MPSSLEIVTRVLLVEPELTAQLAVLDAVHSARGRASIACVATCGGARQALQTGEFDAILLSTNLGFFDWERREVRHLTEVAQTLGLAVLSIGPVGFRLEAAIKGLAVHEILSHHELAAGELDAALERARRVRDCARPLQ